MHQSQLVVRRAGRQRPQNGSALTKQVLQFLLNPNLVSIYLAAIRTVPCPCMALCGGCESSFAVPAKSRCPCTWPSCWPAVRRNVESPNRSRWSLRRPTGELCAAGIEGRPRRRPGPRRAASSAVTPRPRAWVLLRVRVPGWPCGEKRAVSRPRQPGRGRHPNPAGGA
jgi:hypothetical protein